MRKEVQMGMTTKPWGVHQKTTDLNAHLREINCQKVRHLGNNRLAIILQDYALLEVHLRMVRLLVHFLQHVLARVGLDRMVHSLSSHKTHLSHDLLVGDALASMGMDIHYGHHWDVDKQCLDTD